MVWLLQFGQLVALSVKMCGMAVPIWLTCGFEPMCGMAVTIWSTCEFEPSYVWYGCYNLVKWWF